MSYIYSYFGVIHKKLNVFLSHYVIIIMNVSFGWKYSHLCPVYFNQTLIPLSMSNSSIQPKRYLGGRFCEHAIQQENELIMKSRRFVLSILKWPNYRAKSHIKKNKHIEVIGAKHRRQKWINKIISLRSWITFLLPRWGGINTGCITDKYIN